MTAQHFEFTARLSRIESGAGSSKSTLYVGMDDTYQVDYSRRQRPQTASWRDGLAKIANPLVLVFPLLVGVMANLGTRQIAFLFDLPAPTASNIDYRMAMDFVIAMMLSTFIGLMFQMRILAQLIPRMLGIAAGMVGLHNLVHLFPQMFEPVFSAEWVNTIVTTTDPQSLLIRGVSIVF